MQEVTCPNCNVDVGAEELRRNNLRCPTCGFDLSDSGDLEGLELRDEPAEADDDEDEKDEDEDDEKE